MATLKDNKGNAIKPKTMEEYKNNKGVDYYYIKDNKSLKLYQNQDKVLYYKDEKGNYKTLVSLDKNFANYIKLNNNNTKSTTNETPATGAGYTTSGGGYGGYGSYYDPSIADLTAKIDAMVNPKVYSADELAEIYGITDLYNYENILNNRNKTTNQYYDDLIAAQNQINDDTIGSTTRYGNDLIRAYLDSYQNAAPTVAGRGTLAANALTQMLNNSTTYADTATNLNNLIEQYNQAREADLLSNAASAREEYNTLGSNLVNAGVNLNAADVKKYTDQLEAYKTEYAAARNAQATQANAAAQAYGNYATAALAAANSSAKDYENVLKYYQTLYGDNAATAYKTDLQAYKQNQNYNS